jgi:hypothetical protein
MARIKSGPSRSSYKRSSSGSSSSSSGDADVIIKADLDVSSYSQGLNDIEAATKQTVVNMEKSHADSADKIVKSNAGVVDSNKKAELSFASLSNGVRSFMKEMFIVGAVVGIFTKVGDAILKTDFALKALAATARAFDQDVGQSTKVMNELASDGLLTVKQASEGLRYLIQSGYTVDQAENMAKAMKDIGAYNNTIGDLGQAFVDAAKGIRTGRVQLTDNLGLTERFSQIMKRANIDISNGIDLQSNANQRMAFYNSLMQQRIRFEGDAARSSGELNGEWLKLKNQAFSAMADVGKLIENPLKGFMSLSTVVLGAISKLTKAAGEMFADIDAELNKTSWWKAYKENFKVGWEFIVSSATGADKTEEEKLIKDIEKKKKIWEEAAKRYRPFVEWSTDKFAEEKRADYIKAQEALEKFRIAQKNVKPKTSATETNEEGDKEFGGLSLSVTNRWRDAQNKMKLAELDLANKNINEVEYEIIQAEYEKEKNIYEKTIGIANEFDTKKKAYDKAKLKNDIDEIITNQELLAGETISNIKGESVRIDEEWRKAEEKASLLRDVFTEKQENDAEFTRYINNQIEKQRQEDIDFWNEEAAMALETEKELDEERQAEEDKQLEEGWNNLEEWMSQVEQKNKAIMDQAKFEGDLSKEVLTARQEAQEAEGKQFNLAKSIGFHKYSTEITKQYYKDLDKLENDNLLSAEEKAKKKKEIDDKYLADLKEAKKEEVDLHNWSEKMQNTAMDRLIRGKQIGFVMLREVMKQELKEWMYSEGTKWGLKALAEGGEALIALANPLTWPLVPGHLAAAGQAAAIAATFGVTANAIQVDTTEVDKFNDGNTTTTETKTEDKKRLYIHTTDAEIIRKLVPEIGQAIDDGVEIVIGGDN